MKSPRVAMIVDHPLRDLPGLVLVARRLAAEGATVFLVPMYAQDREVFTLNPDFVLLNYIRKNNEHFVEKLVSAGIAYGILDTEGGFYGDMRGYTGVLSYRHDLYSQVRCNLVWGKKMMDFWGKEFPHKHPLVLTGLPRFDFYTQNFSSLKFDFLQSKYRKNPLILVNTKVAVANPLFISVEKEIELYRNKLKMPEEKIQFYLEYGKYSIQDTVQLCRDLEKDFEQTTIVLRPHPHENHRTYEKLLAGSAVDVFREGTVTPWILQSSAVIHRHCTTAIEAALAGKVAVAPQWLRTSAEAPDAEAVSLKPKNRNELNEILRSVLAGEKPMVPDIKEKIEMIIETWLHKMDGQSHVRAASAVLQSLPKESKASSSRIKQLAFDTFSQRQDPAGKLYHLLNQASADRFPSLLWQVESLRLAKWKTSPKYFTPDQCKAWSLPLDHREKKSFAYCWAQEAKQYSWNYPGNSVMVTSS
jgi:surface carbohydrate biosynthesis protein